MKKIRTAFIMTALKKRCHVANHEAARQCFASTSRSTIYVSFIITLTLFLSLLAFLLSIQYNNIKPLQVYYYPAMRRRRSISSHTGGNVVGTLSRYSSSATEEEECERNGNSDETRSRWMSFPCDHFDLLMSRKDVAVTTSVGIAPGSKMEDQQENNKIILQNDSAPSRYSQKELETVKKVTGKGCRRSQLLFYQGYCHWI
jgi:hypothetical protein